MKVVLFCGGLGMRLREYSEAVPKPMVPIGYRPILWHVMKYYAHFGHKDFLLCLGYKADVIKEYFLNYNECVSNDFVLENGGSELRLLSRDIQDWRITFLDTGATTNIGGRLRAVSRFLKDDEVFLANYSDNLTDLPLDSLTDAFMRSDSIGAFMAVRPRQSFHVVSVGSDGAVDSIKHVNEANLWINGGYFVLRRSIFDYMREGEELVEEPFQRLIREGRLMSHRHTGFWACMDTFKERQDLEDLYARGNAPWEVWRKGPMSQLTAPARPALEEQHLRSPDASLLV
jgi:glucose-1-phosphate cytidylyltransferase